MNIHRIPVLYVLGIFIVRPFESRNTIITIYHESLLLRFIIIKKLNLQLLLEGE